MLTEYATERRKAGMSLTSAALSAAKARLRPILMTALTMIFGLFPLMVASGVGANGNSSLGTGTVGGMVIGTLALLFIVPSLFIVFQYLQEKVRPIQFQPAADWQIQEECVEAKEERQHHIESKNEEKNEKQIITLTVAALTLSSCGIYTQYKPATEVPDNLYGEEVAVADTVDNIGNLSWQEILQIRGFRN